jgi:hypothetical protein
MVVVLLVLAALFFIAPLLRTLMRPGQIGCAAQLRTYGAHRNHALEHSLLHKPRRLSEDLKSAEDAQIDDRTGTRTRKSA